MSLGFLMTAISPLIQPAEADPVGAGGKPPGGIGGGAGGEASSFGNPHLPSSQLLVNGTQFGGDCGSTWTYLNNSDNMRCSYLEADKSPADQIGLIVLPNATDNNGWTVSTPCSDDASPHDELDDLPPGTDDGDGTCRQGNGGFVGVGLQDPVLTDPSDVDDFTVVTSSVVKKVLSQGASISIDVKVGTSAYSQGSTWTFTYGLEGKLTGTSGPSFTAIYGHDGLGRRVKSVVNGVTNVYVYSGLSVLYETNPATKYVFAHGLRLARIQGSTTEYYHYDALGNVRLITRSGGGQNGDPIATLAYKPFGLCVYGCASERSYGYTGEYREATPNVVYLNARWYDPTIGRFLSPDDRLGRLSMPQDQNRYAYVVNNPIAYTDPTGHFFWFVFLAFVLLSATANAVLYGATCGSSCSIGGFVGAFAVGALSVAIGYLTAGAGWGLGAVVLASMAENVAGYMIMSVATGQEITAQGLLFNAAAGAAFGYLGYAAGRMRAAAKPAKGGNGQTVEKAAIAGDDAAKTARQTTRLSYSDEALEHLGNPARRASRSDIERTVSNGIEIPDLEPGVKAFYDTSIGGGKVLKVVARPTDYGYHVITFHLMRMKHAIRDLFELGYSG